MLSFCVENAQLETQYLLIRRDNINLERLLFCPRKIVEASAERTSRKKAG